MCIETNYFFFLQGEWVWVKPQLIDEYAVPFGCQIINFDRGLILVRNSDGHEKWITGDQVSSY